MTESVFQGRKMCIRDRFYDAFLVDATTDECYDEVSSQGYAWGYIGSCVPFILCLIVVLAGPSVGIPMDIGMKIAFLITAVWWVAFSVPLIRDVHQTHYKDCLLYTSRCV